MSHEVCRLALHQLVADGRIHPARIEEVVAKVKKQLENEIIETGKRTAIDLGIHGLHPELIRIVRCWHSRREWINLSNTFFFLLLLASVQRIAKVNPFPR